MSTTGRREGKCLLDKEGKVIGDASNDVLSDVEFQHLSMGSTTEQRAFSTILRLRTELADSIQERLRLEALIVNDEGTGWKQKAEQANRELDRLAALKRVWEIIQSGLSVGDWPELENAFAAVPKEAHEQH